jgi:hypothetical protein
MSAKISLPRGKFVSYPDLLHPSFDLRYHSAVREIQVVVRSVFIGTLTSTEGIEMIKKTFLSYRDFGLNTPDLISRVCRRADDAIRHLSQLAPDPSPKAVHRKAVTIREDGSFKLYDEMWVGDVKVSSILIKSGPRVPAWLHRMLNSIN